MDAQHSKDTPEARVQWNLACFEARRNGQPLPPAPWESPEQPNKLNDDSKSAHPFNGVRLPKAPQVSKQRPLPMERRSRPEVETPKPPTTPPTPKYMRETSSPSLRQQPEVAIPMAREKEGLIEALLLRAGIPQATLRLESRTLAVMDNYLLLARSGNQIRHSALLHKYNIGRQFILNGDMTVVMNMAEVVVDILAATSHRGLNAATRVAEKMAENDAYPRNINFLQRDVSRKTNKRAS